MSDVKITALNAPRRALRFCGRFAGGFAVMALLQLAILTGGLETSARAQETVICTGGGTFVLETFLGIDADARTCSFVNTTPPDPANGIRVRIVPQNAALVLNFRYFQNSVTTTPDGSIWTMTNYTGVRGNAADVAVFNDDIPDTGLLPSTATASIAINGKDHQVSISGITKVNGVTSVTYGLVTVTFPALLQPGPSATDKSNITDHLLSSFNKVGGGIFGYGGIPVGIANGTGGGAGFAFTPSGGGSALSLSSQADAINPMDRDYGFLSQSRGYAALGQGSSGQGGKGVNFSINLQNMITNQRKADEQALGVGGLWDFENKDEPYEPRSRWNAWARGRYTDFDDDSANADRDGHLWSITSGLSYALGERTTIGAFTRVRQGEVDSNAFNASLDSDFFGGGIFLATTLQNGVRVMAAGLFEGGDNDIVISGDSGSFDSDQTTLEARIDKRFTRGRHWIEPTVKILYTDLDRDGYTDSSSAVIASGGTTLGRLTFGPTIGTTLQRGNATIKPFARINGVWDFQNEDNFTLSSGTVVTSSDTAIKLGGGLEVAFGNGVIMSAAGDWFSYDDLDGVTVTGGIGVPLSVLGMRHAGSVSLNLASDGDEASAKARISIPLGSE